MNSPSIRRPMASLLMMLALVLPGILLADETADKAVNGFIDAIASNDKARIAALIEYPLQRDPPLSAIKTPAEFIRQYDQLFDQQLRDKIIRSNPQTDWEAMGMKGIMFNNGDLWLTEEGKLLALNVQSDAEKAAAADAIASDKQSLHHSVSTFAEPVLDWKTREFHVRVDKMADDSFRYASWGVDQPTSEKPDLVLKKGVLDYDGSGGNHSYTFKSGPFEYICAVNVLGATDDPGFLIVRKNGKEVLNQPVLEAAD